MDKKVTEKYVHSKNYFVRVLLGWDQFLNILFGPFFNVFLTNFKTYKGPFGFVDETISSVLGKIMRAMDGKPKYHHPIVRLVSYVLNKIDEDHVYRTIEYDEGWRITDIEELLYGK